MNCPLQSEDTLDLLLDYSAGCLDRNRAAMLNEHMNRCTACAAFRAEQNELWTALDAWKPEPVGPHFNGQFWQKVDALEAAPWHRRVLDALRRGAWKPAFPLAAAAVLIAAGFVFDHHGNLAPKPATVNASEAEQVEAALDDIQLLRQFETDSSRTM